LNLDAGNVQLGGVLSEVTNIDANAFDFSLYSADEIFIEGSNVRVNGTTNLIDGLNVTLNGQTMCTIQADTVLQVQSPGYATALNRISALHMIDNSTGEAEFKALNFFPITTVAVAGVYHVSGEDSTILVDPTTAGGVILIDLPAATGVGMLVRVKQITAGAVTIASLSGDLWTTTNVASIPGVHGTTYTLQADGTY